MLQNQYLPSTPSVGATVKSTSQGLLTGPTQPDTR